MLSNKEYARVNKVPKVLDPSIEPFAMFTLDMGESMADGKLVAPHLTGKGENLFDVTPVGELTVSQIKKIQDEEAEKDRQARLALYIQRGYAFESPDSQEEDTPEEGKEDEWTKFFADDTPRKGSGGKRRGKVKSHSSFEGLVDSVG